MQNIEGQLRELTKKLLEEKKVDLVIGYEKGTLPLRSRPVFIREAADTDKLVWNSSCENNLAVYLKTAKGKAAIVAKGCDSRSVVGLLTEKQIERDNIFVIGVPCEGIIDRKNVEDLVQGREVLESSETDSQIILKGNGFEEKVEKDKLLSESCKRCRYRNPVISDELVGQKASEPEVDEYIEVKEFESKSADERWEYFSGQAGNCIRCYACRNACPSCYCPICFVDQGMPGWFSKTPHPSDTLIFHIMRAMHTTGRCVDCGACSRACPMNVELRQLTKKAEKDIKESYDHEVGISVDEPPPLAAFKPDDPQEFMKE